MKNDRRQPLGFILIMIGLLIAGPASAALIFVDEDSDAVVTDNNCSLREAVIAANTNTAVDDCTAGNSSGSDAIFVLVGQTAQSITLGGPLVITDTVSISGPGADNLVLIPSGTGTDYPAFRVDVANAGEDFTLSGLRIGGFEDSALEIVDADQVTVQNVRFLSNSHDLCGGAINALYFPTGPTRSLTELIVLDSEFSANVAGDFGGAICIGGENEIKNPIGADLTIERSNFSNNSASQWGGAVSARESATAILTVVDSIFEQNTTGNTGGLEHGGAIAIEFGFSIINSSLFHDNASLLGQSVAAGIQAEITVAETRITNSTFVGQANSALHAEVFQNVDEARLQHNTFSTAGNGAVYAGPDATARVRANLFVGDVAACQGNGTFITSGYNVEEGFNSCATDPDDVPFAQLDLLPLEDYGGPTHTLPPHPNSVAVDLGTGDCLDATGNSIIADDQRGEPRPRDGNGSGGVGQCDSGAFEWTSAYVLSVGFPGMGGGDVDLIDDLPLGCSAPDFCQLPLPRDQTYTLQATAAPGSQFIGWGGACSGSGQCVVTLSVARVVTANFELLPDAIFSSRFEN